MEQHQNQSLSLLYRILPPCVFAVITALVYYPSLNYDFQFDDIANITKHFQIRHYALWDLFFSGTRWISYWLNSVHYKIGRFHPFTYRVGNVLIHISNGILIFTILIIILYRLQKDSFFKRRALEIASLTSLLFLLHPVQTQTVSYVIQGQLEGMSALFILCMVMLFLIRSCAKNIWLSTVASVLYFFVALFSTGTKEISIISPFLILLVDWFFVAQGSVAKLKKRWWFHGLTVSIIFGIYLYFLKPKFFIDIIGLKNEAVNNLGNMITEHPDQSIKPLQFFISQFKVILHYLWMFIWPLNISVEYDWVLSRGFFAPDCLVPFIILSSIVFIIFKILQRNSTSIIAFAALWFAINIAPRSSIIPSPELLVDYKTYLASFGWLFLLASFCVWMYDSVHWNNLSFKRLSDTIKLPYMCSLILIGILSYGTITRNMVWRSGVDFWANIVKNAPGKARAYNNYGVELSQKLGKFAESIDYFRHAIKMDKFYRDPYNNLAVAYAATHQLDRAIETLQMSLKIYPYYPEAYNNIASFYIEKKEFEQAKRALEIALKLRPYYGKAYFNTARILMEEGETEQAWTYFKKACMEADLDNESGFFGYAKCSLYLKKYDDAIFGFQRVLECNPQNEEAQFSLANSYYMANKFDDAIQVYQAMITKNPHDTKLWYNLAESYFSKGNMVEALKTFEKLKQSPHVTPNLYIRIAACYENLGSPYKARSTLQELLQKNLTDDARKTVQTALQTLNKHYQLS